MGRGVAFFGWSTGPLTGHGPISDAPARSEGGNAPGRIALTQMEPGQGCTVAGHALSDADAELLRAMGLRDHASVVVCRLGEPCIVRVMGGCGCSTRIGLSRPLADRVFVVRDGTTGGVGARPGE